MHIHVHRVVEQPLPPGVTAVARTAGDDLEVYRARDKTGTEPRLHAAIAIIAAIEQELEEQPKDH